MPLGEPSRESGAARQPGPTGQLLELTDAGVFHPTKPTVPANRILRIQGYHGQKRVRPAIRESAERWGTDVATLLDPILHYRRIPIQSIEPDRLILADGTTFMCPAFTKFMTGCHEVVAFVLTLGPGVDATVMELSERFEMLDALLLETAGWLCIEACTKNFADELRRWALPRGLSVAMRMGPGYSYRIHGLEVAWSLWDQKPLFDLFKGETLPVMLLESCAMLPKMSRSGLFGLANSPDRSRD